ncbi:DUF1501 domain-containing protein [Nocardioides coralli]|uniref:DUF1501 domain-containing protein n=1 Tax=Nocardioides coralli TaxID=2872154 RepID=UPI001CA3B26A|nr:DUF1501 domain-containing protein [Nocardioides coralli]QZY27725.1 DUF1501 domain-containing protein [Nocardioides coralli]
MTDSCCPEYAAMTRRGLFTGVALAGTSTLFGSTLLTTAASAAGVARSVLVVVSLRGAADGLSLVVPHADPVYYSARPRIAVPSSALLAKDGFFGLHPDLRPLLPLWQAGRMAAVHATGLPVANRSHFAAMEEVEDADPGSSARVGWLNRLLGTDGDRSPLQGFAVGGGVAPTSLLGPEPFLAADDVDDLRIAGDDEWDPQGRRVRSLQTMWDGAPAELGGAMRSVFRAIRDLQPVRQTPAGPANGASYGSSDLGRALQTAARVIKGNVGVEVLTVDHGDWDMHTNVGTLEWGRMQNLTKQLGSALAGFFTDLGSHGDNVTVVVLSEFGRRVKENANVGLDHGHGNVMFVLGAGVRGGQYYGTWPGLSGQLDSDLVVTTDYRAVLSEVVAARFDVSTASVFPGYTQAESLGLMRSS